MTDSETETISVAEISDGPGGVGNEDPGTTVELPVVDILTGRGFITGKSGSGKSNTASVMIENLLSSNFPVLIVDTDGEYYGLKQEFELLHAGADDECDIQVSPEHAERLATLALEQNVPIILDVSGYLDDAAADELVTEVAKHLFAKEKKLKKPFLMLIEECHEYIPEKGGMDEAGKMLIKIGKRGRKHGLGVVGISQRPADVKKDFITQCDWLVWHRLTWRNDTKVVGRILGSEYADAIEDMGNGEGFLVTDWSESIRRVQFHKKQTFDAGATPGLDDFERPDLKSVDGNLVSDLKEISDEKERRESEIADLKQELEKKNARIRQLERELEEARDLSRMADQFAQAMFQKAEAPYRGGAGRNLERPEEKQAALGEYGVPGADAAPDGDDAPETLDDIDWETADEEPQMGATPDDVARAVADTDLSTDETDGDEDDHPSTRSHPRPPLEAPDGPPWPTHGLLPESEDVDEEAWEAAVDMGDFEPADLQPAPGAENRRDVVDRMTAIVNALSEVHHGMLAHYREHGISDPLSAHVAAGETGDQHLAYGRNRSLRRAGFIRHAGRGQYEYALPDLVSDEYADLLDADELRATVEAIEASFVDDDEE
ncbi:helicase HerA domain-containing protein [Haloferax sp. YSSS75]|uniref:helicase HerA domain-containing protein n=1 Tax=Haloferax sp. YSSS75 TaxID=3388564 RepID=UPI00398D38B7